MRKKIFTLLSTALFSAIAVAQTTNRVGVNTTDPTRTLDVNGDLRIRNVEEPKYLDNILVKEDVPNETPESPETNVVRKVSIKNTLVFNSKINNIAGSEGEHQIKPKADTTNNDNIRVEEDGTITILKSGFYHIKSLIQIKVHSRYSDSDSDRWGYRHMGKVTLSLYAKFFNPETDSTEDEQLLDFNTLEIFKTSYNGREYPDMPVPNINLSSDFFVIAGTQLNLKAKIEFINNIVSNPSRLTLTSDTKKAIEIIKVL